jgi:O-antigen/teichoic acid export membrane protein
MLRAGTWMTLALGLRQPILLVRTFILAQLLTTEAFGLAAIVLVVTTLVEAIGAAGLEVALVQREEVTPSEMNTAWTVEVARGVLSALFLLVAAPFIAAGFNAPAATSLLRFAAIVPLLDGLTNIGMIEFDRELDYQRSFIIQVSRTVVEVVVSIGLALATRSAWSLVIGFTAGMAVTTILSYTLVGFRPRFHFSKREFGSLFKFSSWLVLARYLRAFAGNVDFIVVTRLLGVSSLGVYQMAWRTSFAPINALNTAAIPAVSFAGYSRLQDDKQRMARGYATALELMMSITLPVCATIAVLAPLIVDVLLGEKWADAVVPMQILAVAAGARSFRTQARSVLLGAGDSRILFVLDIVGTAVLAGALFVLTPRWGIAGAAVAVLVSFLVVLPVSLVAVARYLGVTVRQTVSPALVPMLLTLVVVSVGLLTRYLVPERPLLALVAASIAISIAFVATLAALHIFGRRGPLTLLLRHRATGEQPEEDEKEEGQVRPEPV